jgi:lipopolysaccharide transport system ATP-binding protein
MLEHVAIRMCDVAKMYKVFPSRMDNFLDAIGMPPLLARGRTRYKEFWALRGIDLELPVGSRTGLIGRNGAGKSTLLKLITGNIPATEGTIEVHGRIQALLEAGAGFHPEFTGYENIRASLTFQGLAPSQMKEAVEDIVAFTELGDFLAQPYRTYSLGMQARLAFATATAIKPEILIIDEMLGAGDAYFLSKSADRIRQLVTGGASVLLVSHSLDQIVKLCDQAIWIERGKVVCRGTSLEVVKEYERYIRYLDNERLRAKNRIVCESGSQSVQHKETRDVLQLRFTASREMQCEVSEVALMKGAVVQTSVHIGDAQDGNTSQLAYVNLDEGDWSEPLEQEGEYNRKIGRAS